MADKFVTVATFHLPYEGELAKNLLQNEGIASFLTGELTGETWLGNAGLGDQVRLQVHENDAQRAAGILATHQAALEEDWEDRAEHDPDVWVCSLCGAPVSNRLATCGACRTPREGIRADRPFSSMDIRHAPAAPPEPAPKHEELTAGAPATTAPGAAAPAPAGEAEDGPDESFPAVTAGDDMAWRAFWAAAFSFAAPCPLLPIACYYLVRVLAYPGELSPRGRGYFYGATLLAVLFLGLWFLVCAAIAPHH